MPTEHEMKEFFQSVVDQVATLSTQAARVEGLEQRINELNNRVNELIQAGQELNRQLAETTSKLNEVQNALSQTQGMLDSERNITAGLRDTIIQRDTRVQELEGNNQTERDAHRVTLSERDDARRRGDELDTQVSSFRAELEQTQRDRDEWKDRTYKAEAEVNDLKQKLTRVQSILAPLQAISGDYQSAAS